MMKGSHHCFSVWLKIMAISTLCKVYLAFGLFFMFVLFLVPIVIFPCLFCDNNTNDALHAPFIDLLCEHLSDEWCTQMLTVIVSLLFAIFTIFFVVFVLFVLLLYTLG